jgi:outer membrane protein assembly complex protein YaeT
MSGGDSAVRAASPPRPSQRPWRRWAIRVLVLVLLIGFLAHTPPGKRAVATLLSWIAGSRLGGAVRVGALDYRLWAGEVRIEQLALRRPGLEIDGAQVKIEVGPSRGLRAQVKGMRLVATLGPGVEAAGPPSRPWTALSRFAEILVESGELEIRDRRGVPWLQLRDIHARLDRPNGRQPEVRVGVGEAGVGWPEGGIRMRGVQGSARIELDMRTGALRLQESRVVSGSSWIEATGELAHLDPATSRLNVRLSADGALIRQLFPDLPAEGRVEGILSRQSDASGAKGAIEASTPGLSVFDSGPWMGSLRGRFDGPRLAVDSLDLRGYGGAVSGQGVLSAGEEVSHLDLSARGIDVAALAASFSTERPPLASRADATFRLEVQGGAIDTLVGEGSLAFRPAQTSGWPIGGAARLRLSRRGVTFSARDLDVREAHLALEGSLSVERELSLTYALALPRLERAPALLADAGFEAPDLALGGAVFARGSLGGRLPDWRATARLTGEGLSVEGIDLGLAGALRASPDVVNIESLHLEGPEGLIELRGSLPLDSGARWELSGVARGLRVTDALARRGIAVPTTLAGDFKVEGIRPDPRAAFRVEARAEGVGGRPPASLSFTGTASRRAVAIETLAGDIGGGSIEGSGTFSPGKTIEARATLTNVRLADAPWLPAALTEVEGTLAGDARVEGTLQSLHGRVALALSDPCFRGRGLPRVAFQALADGKEATFEARMGAKTLVTGRVPLRDPWLLQATMDLSALPLTDILRARPELDAMDATLTVDGQAVLDLPLREPRSARYDLRVGALDLELAGPWRAGPFRVHGDLQAAEVEGLDLRSGQSRVTAGGGIGFGAPAARGLDVHGQVPLAELAPLLPDTEMLGQAAFELHVSGTLARPDFAGGLRVSEGRGRVRAVPFDALDVEGRIERGALELRRAQVKLLGGEARARGRLALGAGVSAEGQEAEFSLSGVDLASLLPPPSRDSGVRAPLALSGRMTGARFALDAVVAEGQITEMGLASGAQEIGLESPVRWRLERGRLTHSLLRLRGPSSRIDLEAGLDLRAAPMEFRVRAQGDADMATLNPLLVETGALGGRVRFDFAAERGKAGLELTGEGQLEGGRLVLKEPPLAVTNLEGTVRTRGRTIELAGVRGTVGDGRLLASGLLHLTPTGLAPDVVFRAERVPLEYPEGLRTRSSGQLRLFGREGTFGLEGEVKVHTALYQRQTDRKSLSLDRLGSELEALDARGSLAEKVRLGIAVRLEDGLRVDNGQADLVVDGTLSLEGDLATPETNGSLTIRDGGTLRLSRALLRLTEGRVELSGYPGRPPDVNVQGRTQVTGIVIDVRLTGPLDDVHMALSSPQRSDLTQGDLATLLLTGRTASAAAEAGGAIVAEELAAAFGQALDKKLGGALLIDVSRDESLIVEDTNPSQRFNIGVPVARNLYVVYSQALDRGDRRWILDFRPREAFRLRLIEEEDGSTAAEVSHRFGLNLWSGKTRDRAARERLLRVRGIAFAGWPEETPAGFRGRAKVKPGQSFDYFAGEAAARRLEDDLRGRGYLAARVEVEERSHAREVDVTFRAEPGPRIEVEWRGDDPGKKVKEHVRRGFSAYLPIEDTARRLARTARHRLQAERYYVATVEASIHPRGDQTRVVFDTRRGPRGRSVDLQLEGNASVPSATLAAAFPDRRREEFFALLEDDARARRAAAIRLPYAEQGFLEAQVAPPRTSFDRSSGTLKVVIPVEEGERSQLVALDLPQEVGSAGAAAPALALRSGEPFHLDAYVADRVRLLSWYRDQGYPQARVAAALEPMEGGVAVRFAADPGPRATIQGIRLARKGKTRQGVVASALPVKPGDLVRPADLAEGRERLSETRAFRAVDVRAEPAGSDAGARDVVVDLVERNDLDLEYSLRYTTAGTGQVGSTPTASGSGGLQFGGALEAANPFGWAHRYRLYGLFGSERTLFGLSFDAASFFGRRLRTQVFLFDDDDREIEIPKLAQHIRGATFQQTRRWRSGVDGRRWHDRLRMQWGYTFKRIDYTDLATSRLLSGDRAGLIHSLVGDTRDSFTDPHRGIFWSLGTELALRVLGSDVNYIKLYGQLFAYLPLGAKIVWAQGLRLGMVPGDDPLLLLESRFRAGGATTVRGFEESDLGPQTAGGEPLGGQALLVLNEELRFPIWGRLQGGIFYDAGNVFALASELDPGSLRHSAGAGLRVMFPFGPVRVDWGYVLDARADEQRSRWVFTIGHAF